MRILTRFLLLQLLFLTAIFTFATSEVVQAQNKCDNLFNRNWWSKASIGDVQKLQAAGCGFHKESDLGTSGLYYASTSSTLETFKAMFEAELLRLDDTDYSADNGVFHYVMQHGGMTPFLKALHLIHLGADVDAPNRFGTTPLHWAVMYADQGSIALLLDSGANVNARMRSGDSVLHAAVERNKELSVIKLLVDKGANLNSRTLEGDTVIHTAAQFGSVELLEYLVSSGAKVNVRNRRGETLLHSATKCFTCLPGRIKFLLEIGVDPMIKNTDGKTAWDIVDPELSNITKNADFWQLNDRMYNLGGE